MRNSLELYPWQKTSWSKLEQSSHRLPHALLLCGREGIGKKRFATRLAMSVLCESEGIQVCGKCMNCSLFVSSTHPDLHIITSEAALNATEQSLVPYAERFLDDAKDRSRRKTQRSVIIIDQIRALIDQASASSHISKNKVFIIFPADAMNMNSANSLLKVLEEPADNNFLILITDDVQSLLPTIASRCQKIGLANPTDQESQQWLQESGVSQSDIDMILSSNTAPLVGFNSVKDKTLTASNLFMRAVIGCINGNSNTDALEIAQLGIQLGENECLITLQKFLHKVAASQAMCASGASNEESELKSLSDSLDKRKLFAVYDQIRQMRRQMKDGSLNKQLMIEEIVLNIADLRAQASTP